MCGALKFPIDSIYLFIFSWFRFWSCCPLVTQGGANTNDNQPIWCGFLSISSKWPSMEQVIFMADIDNFPKVCYAIAVFFWYSMHMHFSLALYYSCSLWILKYHFVFIYSWVSGSVLESDISHVYACVYELVIDSLPGKQQCACFCPECGWSSEAPHTVSPSWSLERYLQTLSLWGWIFLNYYITESQFHPPPDFTRSSNHHRQSWNQGPAGRLPSRGGKFILQD